MITEQQRQERIGYIGASEAAAVIGMSRWSSPLDVWAEKTGLLPPKDLSGVLAVEIGNELEDLCAKLFERRSGKKVQRVTQTVFHPKYPFIAANLDRRVVGEDAVLEIKTTSGRRAKEWDKDEMPAEVIIQVLHQLAVTGKSVGYACVLIGGNEDFRWKKIDRDEKAIADLVRREVEFWEKFVMTKTPPAVGPGDRDTLTALYPEAEAGKVVPLDSTAAAVCEVLEGMEQDWDNLATQIEEQKNILRQAMGDAEVGTVGPWRVQWKNVNSRRLDMEKMKAEVPALLEQYYRKVPSRRFTIDKPIKGE